MASVAAPTLPATCLAQWRVDPELLILSVFLFALIVAGAMVVARARRWRSEDLCPRTPEEQLRSYEAMVERGELAPEEFAKIKAQLELKRMEPPSEQR